ncbi:MAG: homoserine kinase [Opitutaceae bacterium]|nr:homoserine kinase [Opitutaceae bacterium]
MALYTKLDEKQINKITSVFDIGRVVRFRALEGGSENSNYRIETEDKAYVLTLCEAKSKETVRKLASLLTHLETNGFKSSRVLPTSNGDYLSSYRGKPILLKEFLHGEIVEDLHEETLFEIGALMAALHAVPVPEYMQNRFLYGIETLTVPDAFVDHPFAGWVADAKKTISENICDGLRKGLIHGDIFFNNVVITQDAGPIIMDFEEAGHYYFIFDLGMAIVGSCCDAGIVNRSKVNALVSGYQSISPLNPIEVAKLKPFAAYAASVTACWRFAQFYVIQPDKTKQDRYLEMKQIADTILSIPNEEFCP